MIARSQRFLLALAALALAAPPGEPQDSKPASRAEALDQAVERIDLRDVPLVEALRLLAEESGVNVTASEEASGKKVTTYLQNTTVRRAIEAIAKGYGLWYREDEKTGVVRVMTTKEFDRDLALFRDEKTAVFTLLYPNSLDVAQAIHNLFGDRVRLAFDRDSQIDDYREMDQRFRRFDLLQQRGQGLGGSMGGVYGGGYNSGGFGTPYAAGSGIGGFSNNFGGFPNYGYGSYGAGNDVATNLNMAAELGAAKKELELTQQEREKLSSGEGKGEATAAAAGANSIFISVIRRSNTIAVRTSDAAAMAEIERLIRALDVPTPQVLLEVKILALQLGDGFQSIFDYSFTDAHNSGSFNTAPGSLGAGILGQGPLIYQYVNDHLLARVKLLQDRQRVTELATPVLLVANNEVARFFIGEERPIVLSVSSVASQNNNTTVYTPQTQTVIRPVGTTLLLTPNVNADRTVTLRVLQENSKIEKNAATIPVVTSDGTLVDQPVDVVAPRTVVGTIVAKDGLSIAMGGLIEESISDQQEGIPFLMDLPFLGFFFRREVKQRNHTEYVVLIRPYVLFTANEAQQMSRELAGKLLLHPSGASMGDRLRAYEPEEAARAPLTQDPLKEIFQYQSGLPGGK